MDLRELKEIDQSMKPKGFEEELVLASQYYHDSTLDRTIARLRDLGMGLANNNRPLQISLLRRVIDRLAVIYDRPPTRWLIDKNRKRLDESDPAHVDMVTALDFAQYDLAWRRIDKLRALHRQVVLRFYPSDAQGTVVCRLFEPYNVIRAPGACGDSMDEDSAFALLVGGRRGAESAIWEMWENYGGEWSVKCVNHAGEELPVHPYQSSENLSPYSELPVQIVYDEYTGGQPWLDPRVSRTAWVETINGIANDLFALVCYEAHTEKVVKSDDPNAAPLSTGPSMIHMMKRDEEVELLSANPKINESLSVLEGLIRFWTLSEDLPASEFDRSKQIVTGAARKVESQPLVSRREAQIPLAIRDERIAYRKFRAVHNAHTMLGYYVGPLDEDLDIQIELGDTTVPTDAREMQEAGARALALGTASVIDLIQRERNITRDQAIEVYERVKLDREEFPAPQDALSIQSGPKLAGVSEDQGINDGEDRNGDDAPDIVDGEAGAADIAQAGADVQKNRTQRSDSSAK